MRWHEDAFIDFGRKFAVKTDGQAMRTAAPKGKFARKVHDQRYLFLMSVPFVIWMIIFCFGPISGWLMAFQDFSPAKGILGSPWVGLKHFIALFSSKQMLLVLRNTLVISFLGIMAANTFPIAFALSLNEVLNLRFKKTIQTITYLPHFVSYVVVANIFLTVFSADGVFNSLLTTLGIVRAPTLVWANKDMFWGMVTFVNVWKEIGWNSIIFLAAIASIDMEQYEAAVIDGCGRLQRIWHITLPSLLPVMVLLFILSLGDIFNAGFDASYLLGNPVTRETAEVIDTHVFRIGIENGMFSFSTAVTLFKIVIGFMMVFLSNQIAKRFSDYSLW